MECFLCFLLSGRVIEPNACLTIYAFWLCCGPNEKKKEKKDVLGIIPKNKTMSAGGSFDVSSQ